MKTAEEILDKSYQPKMHWKAVNRKNVLNAMQEYANQFLNAGEVKLPTDEEIKEYSEKYPMPTDRSIGIEMGAKWMRDLIAKSSTPKQQGGDKEEICSKCKKPDGTVKKHLFDGMCADCTQKFITD